jgi:catechol 2,3-dioxygenase-like lactoylglutathione lyase family enzyme
VTVNEVGAVFVPVSDQDRSLEFYVGKLGFDKVADFTYGGHHRWVEVAPPGASNTIALVPPTEGRSAGGDVTRCAFACGDIEAEHHSLGERGVDVDARIAREGTPRTGLVSGDATVEDPVPAQFFFRDPDGNRFLIVQPG